MLQRRDEQAVRKRFDIELKTRVNLKLFTQRNIGGLYIPGREGRTCAPTQQLLENIAGLSPNLHLEIMDFWKTETTLSPDLNRSQKNEFSNYRVYNAHRSIANLQILSQFSVSNSKFNHTITFQNLGALLFLF